MAVTELGHITGSAFLGGPVTLTLTATPSGSDVVIVDVINSGSGACTVSGLTGATWTKIYNSPDTNQILQVWKATGATSAGTISVSQGGGNNTFVKARIVRGLSSSTHSVQSATADGSGTNDGPAITAGLGQWVLAVGETNKMTAFSGETPASGWTNDALSGTAGDLTKYARATRIPTSGTSHNATYTNSDTASNGRMAIVAMGTEIVPPGAPTNLDETHTTTTMELTWDASTGDVTGYEVRIDGGAATDVGTDLDYEWTGLSPGTTYDLEVRAYGPGGSSSWSLLEGTTDVDPPATPTGLVEDEHLEHSITVSWTASTGEVDGYEARVDGGTPTDIGDVLTYEFLGLDPETTYTLEIRAYGPGGESGWASLEAETLPLFLGSLAWGDPDERYFQHGVDRGVLYSSVADAVAWNGIIGVDEASDSSTSVYYIDGRIYLADVNPGDFSGSLMAYFWPEAFAECIGIPEATDGLYVDNQKPKRFGLSYRSLIGSGTTGDMFGYQIHLVYNAMATIGTRSRKSINESPAPMEFQFDLVATPVALPGFRPSAHYIIDTRHLDEATIAQLEGILYGSDPLNARLPTPTELFDILNFGSAITFTDHGDGTWTARGAFANVHMTGPDTWEILNVNGIDHGDGTFTLEDTP